MSATFVRRMHGLTLVGLFALVASQPVFAQGTKKPFRESSGVRPEARAGQSATEGKVAEGKIYEVGDGLKLTGELGTWKAIMYKVKLIAGKSYVIDMTSPNPKVLDPYLRLLDADGKQLAENDDGGGGLKARIVFKVENTGVNQVVAGCFGNGRGRFTLMVREARRGERAFTKEQYVLLGKALQLNAQVISLHRAGKSKDAVIPAQEALAIRKQVLGEKHPDYATSLDNLAILYKHQGQYARAELLYRQVLNIRHQALGVKHRDYATSLNNLAVLYGAQGEYARAEPLVRQALDIDKQVLGEKHPDYATSLNNLAFLYGSKGEYARAEPLYRQALVIRKEVLGEKHPDYAQSLNNLAALYDDRREYSRAEPLYRQALAIRKKTLGDKHPNYAMSLSNLAGLSAAQGDYARAEPLYRQAQEIFRQVLGEKHPDHAQSLNNLANLYQNLGKYAQAELLYRRALDIRKEVLGDKHPHYAGSLNNLAFLNQTQGEYARAESLYRDAIWTMARRPRTAGGAISELFAADLGLQAETLTYLENHALCLRADKKWRAADQTLALAIGVLDRLRGDMLELQESKLFHAATKEPYWALRFFILHELLRTDPRPHDLPAAYWTAEQGSARVFLEALGQARRYAIAGIPEKAQEEERQLLLMLKSLDKRIEVENNKTLDKCDQKLVDQLFDELRKAEEGLQEFRARLEKDYPAYAALKYPRPCDLEDARKCLSKNEVALLFVPGKEASWIVSVLPHRRDQAGGAPDKGVGVGLHRIAPEDAIAEKVAALTDPENLASTGRVRALGREAYELILGPVADLIRGKDLVIVPGGPLALLPFELLVEGTDAEGRFLVENHGIRYAPSLTALHVQRQWEKARPRPTQALWAVGDPDYGADKSNRSEETVAQLAEYASRTRDALGGGLRFERLVHSGREVQQIAKLWGSDGAALVLRGDATEAAVKKASGEGVLAKHRYIHFATHGILGADKGRPPSLVLSLVASPHPGPLPKGSEEAAEGEDGFLQLDEVANLKLNADLVVLSACQTGKGRLARGEGVIGLARGFMYAGCRGVVCSLWSVDDEATSNLMVDFYGHLQKGRPAAEALREAQLAMLRAGKAPLYWAPFILIGE